MTLALAEALISVDANISACMAAIISAYLGCVLILALIVTTADISTYVSSIFSLHILVHNICFAVKLTRPYTNTILDSKFFILPAWLGFLF